MRPALDKSLGQHFLTRPEVCAPLTSFLLPRGGRSSDRHVVEIGSGSGVLTRVLLGEGAEVLAFEIDPRWGLRLGSEAESGRLTVVVADALSLKWDRLPRPILVAGNLPYNVGTAIILNALESTLSKPGIVRMGFLVQREVGDRLTAAPGDPAYGSLSVVVGMLARAEILGHVAPGAFNPPPKVGSSFVGLTPQAGTVDPDRYPHVKRLVRAAFELRRKTLRNSLAASLGSATATAVIEACGLPLTTRAESLGIDTFLELEAALARYTAEDPRI